MKFTYFCFAALIIFFSLTYTFAQDAKPQNPPKSKEQIELEEKTYKLLSEVINEASSLKLAVNRCLIYNIAAGLLWEKGEKLARRLFQNSANELVQYQTEPPNRRQLPNAEKVAFYREIIVNNMRGQLAYSIKGKDAEFALEILYSTRAAELENAVQNYRQIVAQAGKNPDLSKFKQEERTKLEKAVTEIHLEEEIKKEIAKNDPQKLAEFLRAALADGTLSYDFLADLDGLNKKDHDLAQKVLSEIMAKIENADSPNFPKGYAAYSVYRRFLSATNKRANQNNDDKNKELELDEKSVRKIANREFDFLLTKPTTENDMNFVERILYIKQILPERFAEITSKYESAKGSLREWADDGEMTDKLGDNPTFEQVVQNSGKLAVYSRSNYYQKLIGKSFETDGEEKTAQMIAKIPDEKDRERALDQLNALSAAKKAAGENAAEAKQSALNIKSEPDRIAKLIALATFYQQKNTEDSQKIADDLMDEAAKLVNEIPATSTEYAAVLPVMKGYAMVNPNRAFVLLPPIINQSNELLDAYVLLSNYHDNYYPNVSDNEIFLGGQDGYHNYKYAYGEIAKKLAATDFEKTKTLIESFKRADVRMIAKLILIESVLAK